MLKIFIGPNGYEKTYELERIKKSLFDLSGHAFNVENIYTLYNAETGSAYDMNSLIRDTDIRNNSRLILL